MTGDSDAEGPAGSNVLKHGPASHPLRFKWFRGSVVAILSSFLVLCVSSVVQKSSTWDETHYLGAGIYVLKTLSLDTSENRLHPILWTVWHDLPLLATTIPEEVWKERDGVWRGQKIIALRPDDNLLNACRIVLLPFALLLGILVAVWSRQLYGDFGGLLSLTLFCFCPNILAHAALITPDMMFSCFTVLSAHRLWRLAKAPSRRNLLWCGLALGLMLLSKYTAFLLVAALFVTDLVYRIAAHQINWRSFRGLWRGLRHWPVVLGVGFLLVWLCYGFQVGELVLPSGTKVPMPAAPFFQGVIYQYQQSRYVVPCFLMGMYSTSGWWFYYIVVCLIKIPVGILVLAMGLGLVRRRLGFCFRLDELYLAVPFLLVFIYFSCFNNIQLGFRYLLPVYPLLFVLIGKYGEVLHRIAVRIAVGGLALWVVAGSVWIWPDYLAYFNELIGGPRQGYHWLGDSNLDWGQDLKGLGKFMVDHDIKRIALSYFGTADPAHYGIDYLYLPSANSSLRYLPPSGNSALTPRFFAISASEYQSSAFENKDVYEDFYRFVPNHMIGCSILIYDREARIPRTKAPLPLRIRGLFQKPAPIDSCP
jgi:hypothetical protein